MHVYLADKLFQMHSMSGEKRDEEVDNLQGECSLLLHLSIQKTLDLHQRGVGKCIKNI